MNSRLLLPSILFTSLLALHPAASAQEASADAVAAAAAHAEVPTRQLAERYAYLVGTTEAAAELVQSMRADADTGTVMGYGEIDMALALSGALIEAGNVADIDAATGTVMQLRADGVGWGEIAQTLGFNLGDVVSAAHRVDAAGQAGAQAGAAMAIAEEARGRAAASAGAETAASARVQAGVGADVAADARVNARIDAGLRGTTSGRPVGVSVPVLPQRVERPARPERPVRPIGGGR
ncbi:hypothetical protein [Lysobacter sp. D1-1-M9]|uniref:hypothetical protein n=1 Tax=Novilysobacter longmucuonensis TaxID=3098603 RepID=UPI002FCA47BB